MGCRCIGGLLAAVSSLTVAIVVAPEPSKRYVTVTTESGTLRGEQKTVGSASLSLFLSVPFAKPPVGNLRFRPPEPVESWQGTRDALSPARACYQEKDETFGDFSGSDMWNANTPVDEDCLYMNIWAPVDHTNMSVMVWIYGGGFWYGSPSLDIYNAEGMASEGRVIVANINYRIAAFGYLYLDDPEIPGNVGLLDQQMALKWLRANAHHFGGNPDKITLFGESAGAASIVAHMIAPSSRELFSNGILQSGSIDNPWAMDTPSRALHKSLLLTRAVQCEQPSIEETAKCLRSVPAANLSRAILTYWDQLHFMEFYLAPVSQDRAGFFERDAFQSLRTGDFKDSDLIVGVNNNEGSFWVVYYLADYFSREVPVVKLSRENFKQSVVKSLDRENLVVQRGAYATYDPAHNVTDMSDPRLQVAYAQQIDALVGDYQFTCDQLWLADFTSQNKSARVYVYYFDHRSSSNPWPPWMGVMHAYEIEFVFGIPLLRKQHLRGGGQYSTAEQHLSREIVQSFTNFAKTGVPLPSYKWPQYHHVSKKYYVLRAGGSYVKSNLKEHECRFWNHVKEINYQLAMVTKSGSQLKLVEATAVSTLIMLVFSWVRLT